MAIKLRDYQAECVNNVITDLRDGNKKVGVIMATGAGKTAVFIEVIKRYLDKYSDRKVLVLSTLGILTSQTYNRFHQFYPSIPVGILQGAIRPEPYHKVVIATVQSAKDEGKVLTWLRNTNEKVGLIVGDEIHSLMDTETFDKAMKIHDAQLLGVSASFYRKGYVITNLFDKISYKMSMQDLIDKKRLVPVQLKQLVIDKDVEFTERLSRFLSLYMNEYRGKKAIVFTRTVEEAIITRNAFRANNITSSVVTGDVKRKVRDSILTKFASGEIKVLTTCDVLSQGFDDTTVEIGLDLYGTKSVTQFIQRLGRFARPEDGDSLKSYHKKQFGIYVTAGTAPEIKDGLYKKMWKYAKNEGSKESKEDIFDELELMDIIEEDKESEKYKWTKKACDIVNKLRKIGKEELATLLKHKELPARYLRNLDMIEGAIDSLEGDDEIALYNAIRDSHDKWIIPSGKMMGVHVKDVPYYYRTHVLRNYPDSNIGQMLFNWYIKKERS